MTPTSSQRSDPLDAPLAKAAYPETTTGSGLMPPAGESSTSSNRTPSGELSRPKFSVAAPDAFRAVTVPEKGVPAARNTRRVASVAVAVALCGGSSTSWNRAGRATNGSSPARTRPASPFADVPEYRAFRRTRPASG